MEKYPLQTLIMLRDRRYQDALNNQRQKKLLVEQTVRELEKVRSELDEYKKWKVLEIARRYDQIMLSVQTQKQLATFHEGIASLDLKEHDLEEQIILKENALKIAFTRDNFSRELKRLGFDVLPSKANFVFVKKTGIPGKTLYEIAKEEGFLIRYFDIPGIRDFVRISVGTDNEMEGLIEIFKRNFSRL